MSIAKNDMKALELLYQIDDAHDEQQQIDAIIAWGRLQIEKDRRTVADGLPESYFTDRSAYEAVLLYIINFHDIDLD